MNSKRVFLVSLFMAFGIFSGAVIAQPPVKSDLQDSTPSDSELFATELAQLEDSEGENETEASRIFIPTAANAFYLKLLAGLTETFMEAQAREKLLAEKEPNKLWRVLKIPSHCLSKSLYL